MTQVIALSSFEHDGSRKKGDSFDVSEQVAAQLEKRGLVAIEAKAEPAAGEAPQRQRRRRG